MQRSFDTPTSTLESGETPGSTFERSRARTHLSRAVALFSLFLTSAANPDVQAGRPTSQFDGRTIESGGAFIFPDADGSCPGEVDGPMDPKPDPRFTRANEVDVLVPAPRDLPPKIIRSQSPILESTGVTLEGDFSRFN